LGGLIAGIFLVAVMTGVRMFIADHIASGTAKLPSPGGLYTGFALIIAGGFLAIDNGVLMLWKGKPNLIVNIVMIILFVAAFIVIQQATKNLGTP
jgi:hypothetical protein